METQTNSKSLVWIVAIIIFSAVSFFVGTKYQASKTPTFDRTRMAGFQGQGQRQAPSQATGANGANMIRGEIGDIADDTLTIKLPDGSSKIVLLSDTAYSPRRAAARSRRYASTNS